ncbi:MAG: DUF4270 domain-containing protein [Bacteroidaceae bacterium]|nr:DUF4270 domain-containing protein [Bacteroidaceae bacterium]
MNIKTTVLGILAVLFLISCDDDTSGLGASLTPSEDVINVKSDSCFATSRTIKADAKLTPRTSQCNLGRFTEQESGATFEAGYMTQLSCMENFRLADSVYGIGDHKFPQWFIDSVGDQKPYYADIKIYYSKYFGDPTNPIKIEVFALDSLLDSDVIYYPDLDPSEFCDLSNPLVTYTCSGWNYQDNDSVRYNDNYYPKIVIPLPDSIAKEILESYFDPARRHYFDDSESFMRNFIKGFYIRCSQGDGTILYVDRTILEVNFKHIDYASEDDDHKTMISAMAQFPGNKEVLQVNTFKWSGFDDELADNSCTWIRSPFGLLTEITLPIDSMKVDGYVLNSAQLRLSNAVTPSNKYKPSVPSYLLLIRKGNLKDFFAKNNTIDGVESLAAAYSTKFGTYTYENIAAMVELIYSERKEWMTRNNASAADYEAANPDWNKVILIPVKPLFDSNNAVISYSIDTYMRQAKLIGGSTPIKIKTIRSKF